MTTIVPFPSAATVQDWQQGCLCGKCVSSNPSDPDQRAWVACARESAWHASKESAWHAISVAASGGSLVGACGHRVYGPMYRYIGVEPPETALGDQGEARTVCAACLNAIGYEPPYLFRVPVWVDMDFDPQWPIEDPDTGTGSAHRLDPTEP